jgi:sulfopropanediol 3-dehydrogenase
MTITYLKTGKPDAERALDDANTKASVERTLVDIEERGDAAIRDFSAKFDNYTPRNFRLTDQEIEGLLAALSERELADIKFAQEQVRNFAQAQRDSTIAGRYSGT